MSAGSANPQTLLSLDAGSRVAGLFMGAKNPYLKMPFAMGPCPFVETDKTFVYPRLSGTGFGTNNVIQTTRSGNIIGDFRVRVVLSALTDSSGGTIGWADNLGVILFREINIQHGTQQVQRIVPEDIYFKGLKHLTEIERKTWEKEMYIGKTFAERVADAAGELELLLPIGEKHIPYWTHDRGDWLLAGSFDAELNINFLMEQLNNLVEFSTEAERDAGLPVATVNTIEIIPTLAYIPSPYRQQKLSESMNPATAQWKFTDVVRVPDSVWAADSTTTFDVKLDAVRYHCKEVWASIHLVDDLQTAKKYNPFLPVPYEGFQLFFNSVAVDDVKDVDDMMYTWRKYHPLSGIDKHYYAFRTFSQNNANSKHVSGGKDISAAGDPRIRMTITSTGIIPGTVDQVLFEQAKIVRAFVFRHNIVTLVSRQKVVVFH